MRACMDVALHSSSGVGAAVTHKDSECGQTEGFEGVL